MIKINLAQKKAAVALDDEGSKLTANVRYDARLDGIKDLPLQKIGIAVGVLIATSVALSYFQEQELEKARLVLHEHEQKAALLQEQEKKIKGFEETRKALEADEKMIRDKINTVLELVAGRETPPKLLTALSEGVPEEVWIEEFTVEQGKVQMKGFAIGYSQITDFMQNFSRSSYFEDVQLLNTAQGKDSTGMEVATFELQAKRRLGQGS